MTAFAGLLDDAGVLGGQPLDVSLTVRRSAVEGPLRRAAEFGDVRVAALEIIPNGDPKALVAMLDAELPPDVLGYVEVPRGEGLEQALDALAGAVARDLTFKCGTGPRHGFLNVLLATASAQDGASAQDLKAILAERQGVTLAGALSALGAERIARARESFVSFGTCSIDESVADLVKLGLVDQR